MIKGGISINDEEVKILYLVAKFRFLLSRHIKYFAKIPSDRTLYRRLKNLIDLKYLERQKILYKIPGIYLLTHKGRSFVGLNKRADKIRIDQINHDITVLDVVIHIIDKEKIEIEQITSEKELHSCDGFGTRKHHPDFVYEKGGKTYAVEVELSLKTRDRIEENAKLNYLNYDHQIWFIKNANKKIKTTVTDVLNNLANASIEYLEGD